MSPNIIVINKWHGGLPNLYQNLNDKVIYHIMKSEGSILGNTNYNSKDMTLTENLAAYDKWLWEEVKAQGEVYNLLCSMVSKFNKGKSIYLVCVCKPKPCHGDSVAKCLIWMLQKQICVG